MQSKRHATGPTAALFASCLALAAAAPGCRPAPPPPREVSEPPKAAPAEPTPRPPPEAAAEPGPFKALLQQALATGEQPVRPQPQPPRDEQDTLSAADHTLIQKAYGVLRAGPSAEEKVATLRQAGALSHDAVIDVALVGLDDPDREVRRAAIEALHGYTTTNVLAAVTKAFNDEDAVTRALGLEATLYLGGPAVDDIVLAGLLDEAQWVRWAAVNNIRGDPARIGDKVFLRALVEADEDTRRKLVSVLEDEESPRAVSLLVEAMDNESPVVRDGAREALDFLLDQDFLSYDEARDWWKQNRDRFTSDLRLTEPER